MDSRGACDSVAHDAGIFKDAFLRRKTHWQYDPVLFTLVYEVHEFVTRNDFGKDVDIEYTCLGELDYSRLAEICILPEASV